MYQYAGNNPIILVDPDGNYILSKNNDGTSDFHAEKYTGFGRRAERFVMTNIPFIGDALYGGYLNSNNYSNTSDGSIKKLKSGYDIPEKGTWFSKKGSSLFSLAKKAGIIGSGLMVFDGLANNGAIYKKAELAIDAYEIFKGKDEAFINENANNVIDMIDNLIDDKSIMVTHEKNSLKIDDKGLNLDNIKTQINEKYEGWKLIQESNKKNDPHG